MLEIRTFVNCCFVCSVIFIEYHSTMHCNKVLQACRYIAIYLGLPSECQYMACRLTSDIFTKECQHYCQRTDMLAACLRVKNLLVKVESMKYLTP